MTARTVKQQRRSRKLQRTRDKKKRKRSSGKSTIHMPRTKMSEVISHIADPLMEEYAETRRDMERIISLTIAAWNIELLPEEQREAEQATFARKFFRRRLFGLIPIGPDRESVEMFRHLCNVVALRKRRYYPHLDNFIVDVRFHPDEKGI